MTEMVSLTEIKSLLAAIEQGQGVLCERLDALRKELENQHLQLTQDSVEALAEFIAGKCAQPKRKAAKGKG